MQACTVTVHDVVVGQLACLSQANQEYLFAFDDTWLDNPRRPTLGQLFEDRRPVSIRSSGFPAWFAHLLPQGPWGRAVASSMGLASHVSELELLLAVGHDLPGAVKLARASSRIPGASPSPAVAPPVPAGCYFTLAGAQWKISIRQGERGLVAPVRGETGDWIAKFHDPLYPGLPRVELAMTRWAALSGLDVPETRGAQRSEFAHLPAGTPEGKGPIFISRRFDRSPGGGVHFEDFAQVFGYPPGHGPSGQYTGSYEDLGAVLAALSPSDVGELLDRLAFMVVSGNGDAHLKNWGLLYPDRRHPRLSPAYDLVATVLFVRDDDLALTLAGTRRFSEVGLESFAGMSRAIGWSAAAVLERVHAAVQRVLRAWADHKTSLDLLPAEIHTIEEHIRRTPLARRS